MPENSAKNKVDTKKDDFCGIKVLIMGLGLHGGGVESARYLASCGAQVTVTDLKDEKTLSSSIEKLKDYPIRYVLGGHQIADFKDSDLVIKNPGISPDSPYLKSAKRVETDISIFLAACLRFNGTTRLLAVTGSKCKSSVSSALHWTLNEFRQKTETLKGKVWLGGNISISPLSFLDELEQGDDVVLELSSWQLGDLRGCELLKPRAAVITPIMRDHLDRYTNMEAYVNDKRLIYKNQDCNDVTVAADDPWGRSFLEESLGRPLIYSEKPGKHPGKHINEKSSGGWFENPDGPGFARLWDNPNYTGENGRIVEVIPAKPLVPGFHQKLNLLAAALTLLDLGLPPDFIRESLGRFPGIEHRLEFFHESSGIKFYNDSAATIPEAAVAAIRSFEKPPVLVTGGTDKELDYTSLARAAKDSKAIILLDGTGSEKLKKLLDAGGINYRGPFDSLEAAIAAALDAAVSGDNVVLSPGSASFGMFLNEFDRGVKWKDAVRRLFP